MENFVIINNNELEEINGGGIGIIIGGAVLVVGTLVGDYLLEKNTGKNAIQWVGVGCDKAGQALQKFGQTLMN